MFFIIPPSSFFVGVLVSFSYLQKLGFLKGSLHYSERNFVFISQKKKRKYFYCDSRIIQLLDNFTATDN